jgi:hypothetical protein
MADIRALRPAELGVLARLERQKRQNFINVAAHFFSASGSPRPHARRHIIDDGNMWRAAADTFGDRMRKLWAIDNDDEIRLGLQARFNRLIDAPHNARQERQDRQWAHSDDVFNREDACLRRQRLQNERHQGVRRRVH